MKKSQYMFYITRAICGLMTALSLVGGGLLIAQLFLGYGPVKIFINSLSKDGNVQIFTYERFEGMSLPFFIIGIFIFFFAIMSLIYNKRFEEVVNKLIFIGIQSILTFLLDLKTFIMDGINSIPKGFDLGLIIAIFAYWIVIIFPFINRAIEYDEAYTYIEFARHSLQWITSSYYVVNNHIFHTILVHFSTILFGDSLWAIRLPALIMGGLTIPVVYVLGEKLYSKWVGVISALVITCIPVQLLINTRARGYSILSFITVLILLDALYIFTHKNRFAWFLLAFLSALGFYTIPVMLYPFGFVMTWLFINGFYNKTYKKLGWFKNLILSGFVFGLLSLFFYLPVFFKPVADNSLLKGVDAFPLAQFLLNFPKMMFAIIAEWTFNIPVVISVVLASGMILSIVFYKKTIKINHFPLQFSFLIFMSLILLIQRPNLLERSTFWMIPVFIIWAIAGLWEGLLFCFSLSKVEKIREDLIASILLIIIGLLGLIYPFSVNPNHQPYSCYVADEASQFIKSKITKDDVVVVSGFMDAPYWYYLNHLNVPQDAIRGIKTRPFKRVFVVLAKDESLTDVLKNSGPDLVFLNNDHAELLTSIDGTDVYSVPANMSAIFSAFPAYKNAN